jgi:hypothetical protein
LRTGGIKNIEVTVAVKVKQNDRFESRIGFQHSLVEVSLRPVTVRRAGAHNVALVDKADVWCGSINQFNFSSGRNHRLGVMTAFKIIRSNRSPRAALFELLELVNQLLAFVAFPRARQQQPEVVKRRFVVRLGGNGATKSRKGLRVISLLDEYLAKIHVRSGIVAVDFQNLLKLCDCFIEAVLRARNESEQVMCLW